MAGVTTWNKSEAPAGTEPWNYAAQVKRALDKAGLVFEVANQTERDGLAALAPGGVLPVSTTVFRTDVKVLETWNGSSWNRPGPKVIPSAASQVGAALAATAFTTGAFTPIIQPGTKVVATDGSGYFSIDYPTAFPNGVLSVMFTNGDSAQGRDLIVSTAGSPFTQTAATGFGSVVNSAGAAVTSATVRINYIAYGW